MTTITKEKPVEVPTVNIKMVEFTSFLALSLPVVLFAALWYAAYHMAVVPYIPPDVSVSLVKLVFYGLLVGLFQLVYIFVTLGYGLVGIPASLLSLLVLVVLP